MWTRLTIWRPPSVSEAASPSASAIRANRTPKLVDIEARVAALTLPAQKKGRASLAIRRIGLWSRCVLLRAAKLAAFQANAGPPRFRSHLRSAARTGASATGSARRPVQPTRSQRCQAVIRAIFCVVHVRPATFLRSLGSSPTSGHQIRSGGATTWRRWPYWRSQLGQKKAARRRPWQDPRGRRLMLRQTRRSCGSDKMQRTRARRSRPASSPRLRLPGRPSRPPRLSRLDR